MKRLWPGISPIEEYFQRQDLEMNGQKLCMGARSLKNFLIDFSVNM